MIFCAGNVVDDVVTVNRIFLINPVCSLQMSYTTSQLAVSETTCEPKKEEFKRGIRWQYWVYLLSSCQDKFQVQWVQENRMKSISWRCSERWTWVNFHSEKSRKNRLICFRMNLTSHLQHHQNLFPDSWNHKEVSTILLTTLHSVWQATHCYLPCCHTFVQ